MSELQEFLRKRDEALLSLDETKIRAYCREFGVKMPSHPEVFWRAVHKARTAITTLPMAERQKSKDWLTKHGSEHWGDIP